MGGEIQHVINVSFKYHFRLVKQYQRHELFIEMGEQVSELLSYIILLIKIVLLQETISFSYQICTFLDFCSQSLILFVICEEKYEQVS